jgi:hypothetical protein
VSRNGNQYKSFPALCNELSKLSVDAIVDGEVVRLPRSPARTALSPVGVADNGLFSSAATARYARQATALLADSFVSNDLS